MRAAGLEAATAALPVLQASNQRRRVSLLLAAALTGAAKAAAVSPGNMKSANSAGASGASAGSAAAGKANAGNDSAPHSAEPPLILHMAAMLAAAERPKGRSSGSGSGGAMAAARSPKTSHSGDAAAQTAATKSNAAGVAPKAAGSSPGGSNAASAVGAAASSDAPLPPYALPLAVAAAQAWGMFSEVLGPAFLDVPNLGESASNAYFPVNCCNICTSYLLLFLPRVVLYPPLFLALRLHL